MPQVDQPKIELVEETVSIDTERVMTGRVRVATQTEFVEEFAHASLGGERVEVTRVPVGQEVTAVPQTRVEGDVTIIPVLEEIVVVEKRLMLVEEIRIRKLATIEDVSVPVTLRKQRATVERRDIEARNEETSR
ncbi:DUF2382 domain-containing protein (plasmid) [Agrobacterium sp. MA01]|uniref:YsnF/AvaK domain-containing protein n=1 Tax=Agrobacterium sp. MA01 TaxID=2664893 RepID=UPI00129A2A7A|nr:YsnF/AvaK domain-containing protein [Agrobacterium sp. MA01]QGG93244.1 DUF2382 domain-containing protein [Agrobacterium sp. MA01]